MNEHLPVRNIPCDSHHCCDQGFQLLWNVLLTVYFDIFLHTIIEKEMVASKNMLRNNYEWKTKHLKILLDIWENTTLGQGHGLQRPITSKKLLSL